MSFWTSLTASLSCLAIAWPRSDSTLKLFVRVGNIRNATTVTFSPDDLHKTTHTRAYRRIAAGPIICYRYRNPQKLHPSDGSNWEITQHSDLPQLLSNNYWRMAIRSPISVSSEIALWVAEALFFLSRVRRTTSATFLWSISANFPRTRVQMASRNTWFHIPEKFPLRDRICRKSSFYGTLLVTNLRVTGNVLRRLHCFHPLVDIPQMCLT